MSRVPHETTLKLTILIIMQAVARIQLIEDAYAAGKISDDERNKFCWAAIKDLRETLNKGEEMLEAKP